MKKVALLVVILALFGCSSAANQENVGGSFPEESGGALSTGGSETGGEAPSETGGNSSGGYADNTGGLSTGGSRPSPAGGTSAGGSSGGDNSGGASVGGFVGSSGGVQGSGGSASQVCTPGEERCSNTTLEVCGTAGTWAVSQVCPFVCYEDDANVQCIGSCSPGARQCSSSGDAQVCDELGQWIHAQTCTNACSAGSCVGSCPPGETQCAGDNVQLCNDQGSWDTVDTCEFVCSGVGDCIGVCEPGSVDCLGDTPRTCNAQGQWVVGNACPFACSAGSCTGSCVPGAKQCTGSGTQTCNAQAQWDAPVACPAGPHETASCSGAGICGKSCDSGFDDCTGAAGCESDLTDLATCGSCGIACNPNPAHATPFCRSSGCDFACDSGWGDLNSDANDGCEHDLSNDPENCGEVGQSCYGGSCTAGVCAFEGIEKVGDLSEGLVALVADGAYLYGQGLTAIYKIRKDGSEPVVTLATNVQPQNINNLVVEADFVYFVDTGYFNGNPGIYRVSTSGSSLLRLSSQTPFHHDVENDLVYWNDGVNDPANLCYGTTCGTTKFYTVPVTGGSPTLVKTENFRSYAFIKVMTDSLYYLKTGGLYSGFNRLEVTKINASTWATVGALDSSVGGKWLLNAANTTWAVGSNSIYVSGLQAQSTPGLFYKTFQIDIEGGDPTILDASPDISTVMVGDDSDLFYVDNGRILRADASGSTAVSPGMGVVVMAQDAEFVYWVSSTGQVLRLAK